MEIDNTVVNSIVSGERPADITQSIKDILFAKASERIDSYREVVANNMFDSQDDEVENETDTSNYDVDDSQPEETEDD